LPVELIEALMNFGDQDAEFILTTSEVEALASFAAELGLEITWTRHDLHCSRQTLRLPSNSISGEVILLDASHRLLL
jgi:hypothetical protein